MSTDPRIAELEAEGYVVLRAKSYRQAQERQRVSDALRRAAEEQVESTRRWAETAFAEQRRLSDRLTFVYGVARSLGASVEDLAGDAWRKLNCPACGSGEIGDCICPLDAH